MTELTMEKMEAKVRKKWQYVTINPPDDYHPYWNCYGSLAVMANTREQLVVSLYLHALQREQDIEQAREDINQVHQDVIIAQRQNCYTKAFRYQRILAREQTHLDALLIGWKENPAEPQPWCPIHGGFPIDRTSNYEQRIDASRQSATMDDETRRVEKQKAPHADCGCTHTWYDHCGTVPGGSTETPCIRCKCPGYQAKLRR